MFLRAFTAFLVLPGVFAIMLPPIIASLDPRRGAEVSGGGAVLAVAMTVLLWCVRDFYVTGSPAVAAYAVALAIGFHVRVIVHEEPWLGRTFPAAWQTYAASVRRWLPRATPTPLDVASDRPRNGSGRGGTIAGES